MGRKVLVVGLGISGMAAAIRLKDAGWEPTIIERSPARRTGGYFIGLFPDGKEAAEKLGVLGGMRQRTPAVSRAWEVNNRGDRRLSSGFLDQPGKPAAVLRGDIEAALWKRVDGNIDVRFSTSPTIIETTDAIARVTMRDASAGTEFTESYDLVIGADGLRSTVRRLVFGPDEKFVKKMKAMICSFTMTSQVPNFEAEDALTVAEPGRSLWVFPMDGRPPAALLTYRTDDYDSQFTEPPLDVLKKRFDGFSGDGAVEHVLEELENAPDFLFDSVNQVKMPTWHAGRVALLGDAAWCVSLYSGYGASSGLMGAVALGDALQAHGDSPKAALAEWESTFRPIVKKYGIGAHIKGQVFTPSNRMTARIRARVLDREMRKHAASRTARASV